MGGIPATKRDAVQGRCQHVVDVGVLASGVVNVAVAGASILQGEAVIKRHAGRRLLRKHELHGIATSLVVFVCHGTHRHVDYRRAERHVAEIAGTEMSINANLLCQKLARKVVMLHELDCAARNERSLVDAFLRREADAVRCIDQQVARIVGIGDNAALVKQHDIVHRTHNQQGALDKDADITVVGIVDVQGVAAVLDIQISRYKNIVEVVRIVRYVDNGNIAARLVGSPVKNPVALDSLIKTAIVPVYLRYIERSVYRRNVGQVTVLYRTATSRRTVKRVVTLVAANVPAPNDVVVVKGVVAYSNATAKMARPGQDFVIARIVVESPSKRKRPADGVLVVAHDKAARSATGMAQGIRNGNVLVVKDHALAGNARPPELVLDESLPFVVLFLVSQCVWSGAEVERRNFRGEKFRHASET